MLDSVVKITDVQECRIYTEMQVNLVAVADAINVTT